MTRLPLRIGTMLITTSIVSLIGLTAASAQVQVANVTGATSMQVRECAKQSRKSGLANPNLTLAARAAIRLQFHTCVHAAVMLNNGHTASSRSSQRSSTAQPGRSSSVFTSSSSARSSSSALSGLRSSSSVSSSSRSSFSSMQPVSSSSAASSANANQASVNLGAASTFAVLAGSTVTNTGMTAVTGDLGVSPGTAVTGFGPGVVTGGAIHAGDTAAAQAEAALTVAYNNLAGRTNAPVSVSGNLGGSTLSPGLYKSNSSLEISSGDLTLDAKGDANAVFLFQMASTLNVTVGRHVVLIGGAKASNVFWQVGSSATIGTNATFKGTILADQSISVATGTGIEGRLLARIGGVTLQANAVTVPTN